MSVGSFNPRNGTEDFFHQAKPGRCLRQRVVLAALSIQTLVVILTMDKTGGQIIFDYVICISTILILSAAFRLRSFYILFFRSALTTAIVGSLGMILGALMDSSGRTSGHCSQCRIDGIVSWSNGLMLAFCFLGCRLCLILTNFPRMIRISIEIFCMASMIVAMFTGSFFVGKIMPFDLYPGGMHWIMLWSMVLGDVIGLMISISILNSMLQSERTASLN